MFFLVLLPSLLLLIYRTGWHSDDEKALIAGHQIASVSFSPNGGERDLLFKHKESKNRYSIRLAHGSMYVMRGETQKRYKHKIPRRANVTAPRINLTWRQIAPVAMAALKEVPLVMTVEEVVQQ